MQVERAARASSCGVDLAPQTMRRSEIEAEARRRIVSKVRARFHLVGPDLRPQVIRRSLRRSTLGPACGAASGFGMRRRGRQQRSTRPTTPRARSSGWRAERRRFPRRRSRAKGAPMRWGRDRLRSRKWRRTGRGRCPNTSLSAAYRQGGSTRVAPARRAMVVACLNVVVGRPRDRGLDRAEHTGVAGQRSRGAEASEEDDIPGEERRFVEPDWGRGRRHREAAVRDVVFQPKRAIAWMRRATRDGDLGCGDRHARHAPLQAMGARQEDRRLYQDSRASPSWTTASMLPGSAALPPTTARTAFGRVGAFACDHALNPRPPHPEGPHRTRRRREEVLHPSPTGSHAIR